MTGEVVKAKGQAINKHFKDKNEFNAHDKLLQNLKRRFGIRLLKLSGENPSSNVEFYNTDETGHF